MSDSVRLHRRQPTRLPRPWDSPGKNTGVGCHFLLQCMKLKNESEVAQSCWTLRHPMDCSLPGSSIHGIFQARVLEWSAIAFSKHPKIQSLVAFKVTWNIVFFSHSIAFLLIFFLGSVIVLSNKKESKWSKAEMEGGERDKVCDWLRRTRYTQLDTLRWKEMSIKAS